MTELKAITFSGIDGLMDCQEQFRYALIHRGIALGQVTLQNNQSFIRYSDELAALSQTLKSHQLSELVHDTSLMANNFQRFGQMASKLSALVNQPARYGLNSVEAFYLQTQEPGGIAQLNDMAIMFAQKYQKDGHLPLQDGIAPQFFIQLVFKMMLAKSCSNTSKPDLFTNAIQYLEENKQSFGIAIDYMKLKIDARLQYGRACGADLQFKDWFKAVAADLSQVIKQNFEDVGEFQSIQNLNELYASLCVQKASKAGLKITDDLTKLKSNLSTKVSSDSLFSFSDDPLALVYQTYCSFSQFVNFGVDSDGKVTDKSVNAHNCRKSATLSMLFIIHKMISQLGADSKLSELIQAMFESYAKQYIELPSMVTDL